LQDPNFERAEYHPWVASGRPKTANILFAVAFDHRHRSRGVRAAAVHPGDIQTKLGRHMDQVNFQAMIEQINKQLAEEGKGPFEWKTTPRGVRGYALHQSNAEALWKKSEELAGESF
jgi:NAD(P)-dependent dehydrogenase (short-subunit alcohol dehydrogenase family)